MPPLAGQARTGGHVSPLTPPPGEPEELQGPPRRRLSRWRGALGVGGGIVALWAVASVAGGGEAPDSDAASLADPLTPTTSTSALAAVPTATPPPANAHPTRTTPKPKRSTTTHRATVTHRATPTRRATTTTARPTTDAPVYYPNCTAVRAAGKAPLHRGDPGYRSGLDRDKDGLACDT
jgi:hypothetical protein